jgi:TM2 domain-containing membrane protein YozV
MGGNKEQIGRNCPYCGAIVTVDEYFCRACHKQIDGQDQMNAPSTRSPETYIVREKKTYLTVLLSLIGVGLGQFYNGDTLKGLAFFGAFLLVAFGFGGTHYHTVLYFGIWAFAIIEATLSSGRINRYKRPSYGTSYFLYAGLFVLAGIVALHFYTGLPDMEYLRKIFPVLDLWMMYHVPV